MVYNFKTEDRQYYSLLEDLSIIPYLEKFLASHKLRIEESFKSMLAEMKLEEKNILHTQFIKEMNFDEFFYVVEFTFFATFSKDMVSLLLRYNAPILSLLSAHSLAKRISKDTQNPTYVGQLERVISNCCDSVLLCYRNISENDYL